MKKLFLILCAMFLLLKSIDAQTNTFPYSGAAGIGDTAKYDLVSTLGEIQLPLPAYQKSL